MKPRIPPKPRTPALITPALVAVALGAPACAAHRPEPSRIGPPDLMEPPRIGPPACETFDFASGIVHVGSREPLANQAVTISIAQGEERIVTTDAHGQFRIEGAGPWVGPTSVVTVPGYETVNVDVTPSNCFEPVLIEITLRPKP